MGGQKIAELLYSEFGHREFLTRQISKETMSQLLKLMGITEAGHASNTKVGKAIGSLDGKTFTVGEGQKVRVNVKRPVNSHLPRRFRLAGVPSAEAGLSRKEGDSWVGIEFPWSELAYTVVLTETAYGYSVSCPALRGCHSQGLDEVEALENIREAISGWLKFDARDAERRTRAMLEENIAAGYPSKLVNIRVGQAII